MNQKIIKKNEKKEMNIWFDKNRLLMELFFFSFVLLIGISMGVFFLFSFLKIQDDNLFNLIVYCPFVFILIYLVQLRLSKNYERVIGILMKNLEA